MEEKQLQDEQNIQIRFDDGSNDYYIAWQSPVIISSGRTEIEALKDFKNAVYSYIDLVINRKLKEISK